MVTRIADRHIPSTRPQTIRVVVVEDHTLVLHATRAILGLDPRIRVVGGAESATAALLLIEAVQPDVALVDIRLRDSSGVDLTRAVRRRYPAVKVVALTAYGFGQYVAAMARAGAVGYVLKGASGPELIRAVCEAYEGRGTLPLQPDQGASPREDSPRPFTVQAAASLTVREMEVLELLEASLPSAEIASRLGLSRKTVNAHTAHILAKLGEATPPLAVNKARALGLL